MKTRVSFILAIFFSATLSAQPIVVHGLVAFFPFNSNALDETGNGNDAVVHGATLTADRFGALNSAYFFDGLNSYIEAVKTTLPTENSSRSVCLWMKSSQNSLASIINIGTLEAIDTLSIFEIYLNHGSVGCWGGSAGPFNDDRWHHIAVLYDDSTRDYALCMDGQPLSAAINGALKPGTAGSSLRIGAPLSPAQHRQSFTGVLDEVRIYNRYIKVSEIDSLYREGLIVGVSEYVQGSPATFALLQNYPNPFNPTTAIKFELPKASRVNLSVFDILGREVSVLVEERREAGVYEVKFDGSNLAGGVYFYRLQAGDFVQSKRLMIVK